jgi:cytochrome P450
MGLNELIHYFFRLIHLLSVNPSIQARVQRELDQVLGPDRECTYEDLAELKYVDACLKETLRSIILLINLPFNNQRLA